MEPTSFLLPVLAYIVGAGVLYLIIRLAVTHALRSHTVWVGIGDGQKAIDKYQKALNEE
jgi:uncharacterized membrane-anchored protein YhcB (DUF1043 family)